MKLKKLFKNKLAFTLVELIVVIAILAILASVATVSTIAILNNTRKTPVENAVDAVKNTITIYIASGGKFTWKDLAPELAKMENRLNQKGFELSIDDTIISRQIF